VTLNRSRLFPSSPRALFGLLVLASLLLAACGGVSGESWAGLSTTPDGDQIFVSYGKRIAALDPATGERVWSYPDEDDRDAQFFAVPVVADDTIYVGDYKGRLHAVSREGDRRWIYEPDRDKLGPLTVTPEDRVISGVAVDDEQVYFGLGSRNVVAVSREDGRERWIFETGHGVWATPVLAAANPDDEASRPVLYVVSLDHHLYALNPANGDKLWDLDLGGAAPGGLLYDAEHNRAYIGTFLSELLAVDLDTHKIVARYETEGWVWDPPAMEEDLLYFGDLSGHVYAVRITEGGFEEVWKQEVSENRAIRATPLLNDEVLVVGSRDKHVYALSKDNGTEQWDKATKGEVLAELRLVPGAESDLVIASTSEADELVVAYQIESGEVDWRYKD
jgi:outer membrane protein assembly factor BamB